MPPGAKKRKALKKKQQEQEATGVATNNKGFNGHGTVFVTVFGFRLEFVVAGSIWILVILVAVYRILCLKWVSGVR
jgi:hypothetical protein